MIKIPNVTLIAVSSIYIEKTISMLQYSYREIGFGKVKLITHEKPKNIPCEIEFCECPKINNIMDYNNIMFFDIGKYISTSHCLIIQHDSAVIFPEMWDENWLQWDYIGAPFKIVENAYWANNGERVRVGNGGFSLRSTKILNAPKKLGLELKQEQGFFNEDGNLVCYNRRELLNYGIRYAPVEIAAKFSFENETSENLNIEKPFGFHKNIKYAWAKELGL